MSLRRVLFFVRKMLRIVFCSLPAGSFFRMPLPEKDSSMGELTAWAKAVQQHSRNASVRAAALFLMSIPLFYCQVVIRPAGKILL